MNMRSVRYIPDEETSVALGWRLVQTEIRDTRGFARVESFSRVRIIVLLTHQFRQLVQLRLALIRDLLRDT